MGSDDRQDWTPPAAPEEGDAIADAAAGLVIAEGVIKLINESPRTPRPEEIATLILRLRPPAWCSLRPGVTERMTEAERCANANRRKAAEQAWKEAARHVVEARKAASEVMRITAAMGDLLMRDIPPEGCAPSRVATAEDERRACLERYQLTEEEIARARRGQPMPINRIRDVPAEPSPWEADRRRTAEMVERGKAQSWRDVLGAREYERKV